MVLDPIIKTNPISCEIDFDRICLLVLSKRIKETFLFEIFVRENTCNSESNKNKFHLFTLFFPFLKQMIGIGNILKRY